MTGGESGTAGVCGPTSTFAGCVGNEGKYVYAWTGPGAGPAVQENNNDKGNTAVSRWSVMLSFKYQF